ncbi:hypothetical protein BJ123_110185 [Rhodopseudomonas thermotolerans]|uniref:Uncharacterized protein n=2 Tax=Rhodopseudomonas TaxID=1073 RepID=A0A336JU93_9BRAD|nr:MULTISPECIES: hypothetical protein [Rhodopseudomonas]RED34545.1 hypothetical protein BJ125_110185 [Rhodopseudomonas pentothenatexigens]REG02741.1 hypothetical protein BJ123_110185 [Rhodopseudomonas thermotolerans]SSW91214.1 hypothetical protein SAMN05892882_110185 [Rhodopseudomonas pentothenatexigens]
MSSVDSFLKVMREHDTATAALIAWCRCHYPDEAEAVTITLLTDQDVPADGYDGPLRPKAGETLRRRRVWLRWGDRVLSEAENWYVPERLPPAMREAVADGTQPYGAVVAGLRPQRITITALRSDQVRADRFGTEAVLAQLARTEGFSRHDAFVLHIHAVMMAAGIVLAELREHYRRELLP